MSLPGTPVDGRDDVRGADSIPSQIGPYRVTRILGVGGMGKVYHAVHQELRREVALKVLEPSSVRSDGVLQRFRLEARAASIPHHENVVMCYEHGADGPYHYLALEYVDGKDILFYIDRNGRLTVKASLHVIKQAAKALRHAHKHGIIHRDIKPSNLLINSEKQVKLTDMGLARQLAELEEEGVTRDGTTVGTVDYIAPEQARRSRDADIRSDIYSLGCTWYHMLAGEVPFPGGSALDRLQKHLTKPIPDIRRLNENVPDAVAETIKKMMAKDPRDRFQSPSELLAVLERLPSKKEGEREREMDSDLERPVIKQPKQTKSHGESKSDFGTSLATGVVGLGLGVIMTLIMFVMFFDRKPVQVEPAPKAALAATDSAPTNDTPTTNAETANASAKSQADGQNTRTGSMDLAKATIALEKSAAKQDSAKVPAPVNPPAPPKAPAEKQKIVGLDFSKVKFDPPSKSKVNNDDDAPDDAMGPRKKVGRKDRDDDSGRKAKGKQLASAPGDLKMQMGTPTKQAAPEPKKETKLEPPTIPAEDLTPDSVTREPIPLSAEDRKEFLGPWDTPTLPAAKPKKVVQVGRLVDDDSNQEMAGSLRTAWNKAQTSNSNGGAPIWLELNSNGPFFDGTQIWAGRSIVFAAAEQSNPMLVYQELNPDQQKSWFTLTNNKSVEIEGIHFALYAGDIPGENEDFNLFRIENSDVTFNRCTFTILGSHRRRVSVARLVHSSAGAPKIRFKDCVMRAHSGIAVTCESSKAEILFENSCLISQSSELFLFRGHPEAGERVLRLSDCSLLSGADLIRLKESADSKSQLRVMSAATAVVAAESNSRRPLVQIDGPEAGEFTPKSLIWRDLRTLFVSWPHMLAYVPAGNPSKVLADDEISWRRLLGLRSDGSLFVDDPAIAPLADDFVFSAYPVFPAGPWTFGDSGAAGTIGYDPSRCLAPIRFWFEKAFGRLDPLAVDFAADLRNPPGEGRPVTIDVDVASMSLHSELRKHSTASRIEVRVTGTGTVPLEPIKLEHQTLSIVVQPAPADTDPLVFEPKGKGDALFEIEGGSLYLENVRINAKGAEGPDRLIRVQGGDLSLVSCRFETSLASFAIAKKELIRFEASPWPTLEQWHRLMLESTYLCAAGPLIATDVALSFVDLDNCVLLTETDAVQLVFQEQVPANWFAGVQATKTTFSAGGSAFRIQSCPPVFAMPAYPVLLTAEDCLFTDALDVKNNPGRLRTGSVVSYEADVLAKGLVAWQGACNSYDRRLGRLAAPAGSTSRLSQDSARIDWNRLWGVRHEVHPMFAGVQFDRKLRLDAPELSAFALAVSDVGSVSASDGKQIGADLTLFGERVKPTTRQPPTKLPESPESVALKRSTVRNSLVKAAPEKPEAPPPVRAPNKNSMKISFGTGIGK